MLTSENVLWLLAEDECTGEILASAFFKSDWQWRIAKLEGVVVHPKARGSHLASALIASGMDTLLVKESRVDSIYTTTRTVALGPQRMCLRNGFHALGIFPNSRKLRDYETLTLMGAWREGVLQSRLKKPVAKGLEDLYQLTLENLKLSEGFDVVSPCTPSTTHPRELEFEAINAPHYVQSCFQKLVAGKPAKGFYPFHTPNHLFVNAEHDISFFVYISEEDRYCTLIACNKKLTEVGSGFEDFIRALNLHGVAYIETLVQTRHVEAISLLQKAQFIPSAIYPAMLHDESGHCDMAILSRCMEPLSLKGVVVDKSFKCHIDHYLKVWKETHIENFEVCQ